MTYVLNYVSFITCLSTSMADAANLRFKTDLSCSQVSASVSNNKCNEQDLKRERKETNSQQKFR